MRRPGCGRSRAGAGPWEWRPGGRTVRRPATCSGSPGSSGSSGSCCLCWRRGWQRSGNVGAERQAGSPGGGGDGTLGESALRHTLGAPSWGRRPDPGRGVTARDCQPGHQDRQDFLQALGTWKPGVLGDITSTAADRGPTAHSGLGHRASGPMGPQRLFLRPEEATCCFTGEAAKNP